MQIIKKWQDLVQIADTSLESFIFSTRWLCNPWCPQSSAPEESVLPPVIASSHKYKCLLVCAFLFEHLYTRCLSAGGAGNDKLWFCLCEGTMPSPVPPCLLSFSGSELLSLCFLAQQGAQPWTGPLAVVWRVILPNRICILAAAVLGSEAEYMEANCAYTDIAEAQPFRTPVDARVARKFSI